MALSPPLKDRVPASAPNAASLAPPVGVRVANREPAQERHNRHQRALRIVWIARWCGCSAVAIARRGWIRLGCGWVGRGGARRIARLPVIIAGDRRQRRITGRWISRLPIGTLRIR
ncbi:MAG: hypothetical protein IPL59_24200 [Candidatus Competibacteraceae bacterium]|nr:hypothetical protein [Candidatus Competibacteraceae bacterium]